MIVLSFIPIYPCPSDHDIIQWKVEKSSRIDNWNGYAAECILMYDGMFHVRKSRFHQNNEMNKIVWKYLGIEVDDSGFIVNEDDKILFLLRFM